jgi:putative transposase
MSTFRTERLTRRTQAMRRLSPSVLARAELEELIVRGAAPGEKLVSSFVELVTPACREGAPRGRADRRSRRARPLERRGDEHGQRNGYMPGHLRTAEGDVELRVPQVRGAGEVFRLQLLSFLEGNCEVLERLVCERYARGMSTRDIEDAFRGEDGTSL